MSVKATRPISLNERVAWPRDAAGHACGRRAGRALWRGIARGKRASWTAFLMRASSGTGVLLMVMAAQEKDKDEVVALGGNLTWRGMCLGRCSLTLHVVSRRQ